MADLEIVLEEDLRAEDDFSLEMRLRFYDGLYKFGKQSERINAELARRAAEREQQEQQ